MASESGDDIRVLHVDDDADFVSLSQELLEREDQSFHVETATSVSDGLDRLSDGEIDCIVSDYDMPQQNGLDFLEAVRETSSGSRSYSSRGRVPRRSPVKPSLPVSTTICRSPSDGISTPSSRSASRTLWRNVDPRRRRPEPVGSFRRSSNTRLT